MEYDVKTVLGILAAGVAVVNYLPYLIGVFKKTVKPHIFSWIIWTLMTGITFFAQMTDQAGPGAWATGITSATLLLIVIFTLKNSEHSITRADWWSFGGALVAIPVWVVTGNPLWSVVIVTVIETLGFFPTFRKGYHTPHEDSVLAFTLTIIKYSLALAALTHYSVTTVLFPAALVVLSSSLVAMLLWRRWQIAGLRT